MSDSETGRQPEHGTDGRPHPASGDHRPPPPSWPTPAPPTQHRGTQPEPTSTPPRPAYVPVPPEIAVPPEPTAPTRAPTTSANHPGTPGRGGQSGERGRSRSLTIVGAAATIGLLGLVAYVLVPRGDEAAGPSTTTPATAVTTGGPVPSDGPAPTEPEVTAEPAATIDTTASGDALTEMQERAAGDAKRYLRDHKRGRRAVIRFLTDEQKFPGYSEADATIGVDSLGIDWDEVASEAARGSIDQRASARTGLIGRLAFVFDFTAEEAITAVDGLDVDWEAQPARYVDEAIGSQGVSRQTLLRSMTSPDTQFDAAVAEQAIDAANVDWNAEAALAAEEAKEVGGVTRSCDELIEYLQTDFGGGFPEDQATFGAKAVGAC